MKTIYKYKICSAIFGDSVNEVEIPKSAYFLKVARQNDDICAWYLVNPEETEKRKVKWFQVGTGHTYPDVAFLVYRDTIVCDDFGLVWNMFSSDIKNSD